MNTRFELLGSGESERVHLADLMVDNPFDSLSLGCDFARNFGCRHLDFACMHLWPDSWTPR
jgi:hypothetical protein